MNKCYLLQWYVNAYDQEGAVTLAVFKNEPDFHKLKKCITNKGIEINSYLDLDVLCGKLSRMEDVTQYTTGGGDLYKIEQWELN